MVVVHKTHPLATNLGSEGAAHGSTTRGPTVIKSEASLVHVVPPVHYEYQTSSQKSYPQGSNVLCQLISGSTETKDSLESSRQWSTERKAV